MIEPTFSMGMMQILHLYLSLEHKRKGRLDRARKRLEKALSLSDQPDRRILAYDALLMIKEGNVHEANLRLLECLNTTYSSKIEDDEYVTLYCQLFLAIGDPKLGFDQIQRAAKEAIAARQGASRFVRVLLPLFSIENLEEICRSREAAEAPARRFGEAKKPTQIDVVIDF